MSKNTRTVHAPKTLFRSGVAEIKDGTARLSISSDTPYLRYDWMSGDDYYEVLSHDPAGMDMGRLKGGAALLFNHNRDIQLGTLSDPVIENGKCYVTARLSEAPDIESYRVRMKEGILKDTSVGYSVDEEGECIGAKDGVPVYRFNWSCHEASMVTIPADTSVGLGRDIADKGPEEEPDLKQIRINDEKGLAPEKQSSHKRDNDMKKFSSRKFYEADKDGKGGSGEEKEGQRIDVVEEQKKAVSAFKGRCQRIDAYVEKLSNEKWKAAAAEVAKRHKDGDANFDEFRNEAVAAFEGAIAVDTKSAEIGMSKKDISRYSLARAIFLRGTGKQLDGLEKEASDAQAKILKKDADGFFIPEDVAIRSLQEARGVGQNELNRTLDTVRQIMALQGRNLTAGNFTSAGALIGVDLLAGSLIELLRNKQFFASLGTTMLGGLVGNIAIPRQSGGATAYWLAEGASVTESDQTFQQIGMTPHRLVAQTAYDKQLVAQASLSVEAMVRNDIAIVMAIKKDLAILQGSGVAGEPLGILNTTGVQTVTFGGAATWAKILEFETDLATQNADQTGTPVFLTNPTVRGKWKNIPKIAASTFPIFLWGDDNKVNGYNAYVSNQILTSGATANFVYYGVPSEIIDAMWAGIDVVVNPYSLDSSGQIRTTVTSWSDIALRHAPAWVVSTDSGGV